VILPIACYIHVNFEILLLFDLFMLHNPDSPHGYPYVAISNESNRILNICDEHIHILNREDTLFFESDYLPMYKQLQVEITKLDELINTYTHMDHYNIIARFNDVRHVTLTYHSPTNEGPKDYDIFIGYPSERAQKLIRDIYPMLEAIRTEVTGL